MGWQDAPEVGSSSTTSATPAWMSAPEAKPSFFGSLGKQALAAGVDVNEKLSPLMALINKFRKNPKGAAKETAEALPTAGSVGAPLAATALTGGVGAIGSTALAGMGRAAGEYGKQAILDIIGENPVQPVTYPFTNKTIPDVPGVSPSISNVIKQAGVGAAEEATPRALGWIGGKMAKGAGAIRNNVMAWFTGKKASEFKRLAEDPKAILPPFMASEGAPPSMEKATSDLADSMRVNDMSKTISPVEPKYGQIVEDTWEKVTKGIPKKYLSDPETVNAAVKSLPAQEAFDSLQAVKKLMKFGVEGKDKELLRNRVIFKNALIEHLSEMAPEFGAANKEVARAFLRSSMTDILPSTKYGTPSLTRSAFVRMLGLPAGVSSPIVNSAVLVGGQAAGKVIENPTAVKYISDLMRRRYGPKSGANEGSWKPPEDTPPPNTRGGAIPSMDEKDVHDFIQAAPEGTKFKFNGSDKVYKVVPRKERKDFKNEQDRQNYEKSRRLLGAYRTKTFTLA